jgi:hypothetical protein
LEVVTDSQDGAIEEGGEKVNGVGVDAHALVASSMLNGVANVTWKGERFGGLEKKKGGGNPAMGQWEYTTFWHGLGWWDLWWQ